MSSSDKVSVYDSLDADVVQSYMEYSLASMIYYCMKEGATSEQSSRMSAMDNSSKNAGMNNEHYKLLIMVLLMMLFFTNVFPCSGEMIDKLTITFNRTRQAVITGELIEIISGAAAL